MGSVSRRGLAPIDALYFGSPSGEVVTPETVRRFKLNLLGKRLVKSGTQA